MSDKPDSDPYVCFRRRELKPLRKMRRSDGQSLEKLTRLRNELLQAKEILNLVVARENCKKEALELDIQIFEERVKIRKLKEKLGIAITDKDWDIAPLVRPKKKAKKEDLRYFCIILMTEYQLKFAFQLQDLRMHLHLLLIWIHLLTDCFFYLCTIRSKRGNYQKREMGGWI